MYGAIIGDICGSVYKPNNFKTYNPSEILIPNPRGFFTSNTVLTCVVIDALLSERNYKEALYRDNGAAAQVSPVGWAFDTIEETLTEAKRFAEITHNHPEGIKSAQATAAAVFLARNKERKDTIKKYIEDTFGYNLHRTLKDIRPQYALDESCQGAAPEAIIAFLESDDYTGAIQYAISLCGDSTTLACIAGGIAEAYYSQIPDELLEYANNILPAKMKELLKKFYDKETVESELIHVSMEEKNGAIFRYLWSRRSPPPSILSQEEINKLLDAINSGDVGEEETVP